MSETVDPGQSVPDDSEGMQEHPVIALLQREWDSPSEVSEEAALQARKALHTFPRGEPLGRSGGWFCTNIAEQYLLGDCRYVFTIGGKYVPNRKSS